jgi:hypothetical protein
MFPDKQSCQSLHFYFQIANTVYAYYTLLKNVADSWRTEQLIRRHMEVEG